LDENVKNIDRFQIRKVLGEGGAGIVYLAYDPKLKRDVAIKTLAAAMGDDTQTLLDEAQAVGALRHPCIVPVFETGELEGAPYLVFEYVTGETLNDLIRRSGPMPAESALKIAAQVLDGLAHAHRNGVLHRDIKPANIILASDGTPRIMDFGAASRNHLNWLNQDNVGVDENFIGTPAYMAPEYIESKLFSARTDIFAMGLVICEMLTGQRVFRSGPSIEDLLHRIVHDPIVLPTGTGMSEKIVACLLKALAKNPEERYGSVLEMKQALLLASDSAQSQTAAPGRGTLAFLLRRMKLKKEFPAMSQSIANVNRIILSDKGSVTTLTNAILKDFALTSKIIKLANSSYYNLSGSGSVSTISSAIIRLGFDTIRNIVLGLLLFDQIKDRDQAQELMSECVHAILSGSIAKEICVFQGYGNPEETFVCAMMHNLGRILSLYYFHEETGEIRKLLALGQCSEEEASRRVLGASFTELGQGVAKSWGFPQNIVGSMDKHLPPYARAHTTPDETLRLVACMASDLCAVVANCDPEEQKQRTEETLERYQSHLKLKRNAAEAVFSRALDSFNEYTQAAGWRLDQTIVRRLGALRAAAAADSGDEVTQDLQPQNEKSADIELAMDVGLTAKAPEPAARPPARPRKDILSGGTQDITNAMVEGRSLNDILRIIIETIYTGIGSDHVVFALRDPKSARMAGRFGLGDGIDALIGQFQFSLDYTPDVFHVALQRNTDILISDTNDPKIASRIPDWYRRAFSAGCFVLFPIVVKDRPFGMIYADVAKANSIAIEEDELKLLRTLRNQAVLAMRQSG
jgi:serine/threonine protein kinase